MLKGKIELPSVMDDMDIKINDIQTFKIMQMHKISAYQKVMSKQS